MNLWFLTDSIHWTAERLTGVNTPELGGGVGGAEAMTTGLCRHLIERGHTVTVWATKCEAPAVYDGLRWRSVEKELRRALLTEPSPDVLIAVRRPQVFSLPELVGLPIHRVLWAHDVLERSQGGLHFLKNVDTLVYVSRWHRNQWESIYPPLAKVNSFITPVALDARWIQPANRLRRDRYIYASCPQRGLIPLLQMWPRIRKELPEATLIVTGYSADIDRITLTADRLIERANAAVGGIEVHRSLDKVGYYKLLAEARLLLYPGHYFEETNGHVCSEGMATGAVPIVSHLGALPETLPMSAGILVEGDAMTEKYQNFFVKQVLRLSSSDADAEIAHMQDYGRLQVLPRCTYPSIADLWDTRLREIVVSPLVAC